MADMKRKETETINTDLNESGAVVKERTKSVQTTADKKSTVVNLVWYLYQLTATVLVIRFILKLFGANSENGFVNIVYSGSKVLSAPFDSIFGVTSREAGNTESVFEPSILVAVAVYALIAWGITKLLTVNEK